MSADKQSGAAPSSTPGWIPWLRVPAVWAGGALGLTLLLAYAPLHGPTCYFRLVTGLPCPACGLTRSFGAIWHGDLAASFHYHPLGVPAFAVCAWLCVAAALPSRVPGVPAAWSGTAVRRNLFLALTAVWLFRLGAVALGGASAIWW